MTQQHPITPPRELVQEWTDAFWNEPGNYVGIDDEALATRAAQWGADQELEACCDVLARWGSPRHRQAPRHPTPQAAELEGAGATSVGPFESGCLYSRSWL